MATQESFTSQSMRHFSVSSSSSADDSQLARAGFFYQPTSSCLDNTCCYLCQSNLDGWELDDDAIEEHLKHAPNCGWAITVSVEQDIEYSRDGLENPMSEKMLNARQMTFGSNWPHENKRGWTCKTRKVHRPRYAVVAALLINGIDDRGWMALLPDLGK